MHASFCVFHSNLSIALVSARCPGTLNKKELFDIITQLLHNDLMADGYDLEHVFISETANVMIIAQIKKESYFIEFVRSFWCNWCISSISLHNRASFLFYIHASISKSC